MEKKNLKIKKTTSHHTPEWFDNHKLIDEYIKLPDFEERNKLKTNMCKEGDKCNRKATCFFAHKECYKRKAICSYGSKCRILDCWFDHSKDARLPTFPVLKHKNVDFVVELSDDEDEEKKKRELKNRKKFFVNLFEKEKEIVETVYNEMAKSPKVVRTEEQNNFFETINVTKQQVEEWSIELKQELNEKLTKSKVEKVNPEPKKKQIIFDDDSDDEEIEIKIKPKKKDIKNNSQHNEDKFVKIIPSEIKDVEMKVEKTSLISKLKTTKRKLEIMCSNEEFETVLKMLKAFDVTLS